MVHIVKCENRIIFNLGNKLIVHNEGAAQKITLPDPPPAESHQERQINENRNISCICVSKDQQLIAVSTENKQIIIFNTDFQLQKTFTISRTSNLIYFTSNNSLIVADKTGDVYLYHLEKDNYESVLLLGHLSVVLDLLVTDSKYIVTCDRDEKIRVSHFPNSYNIQSFCLGHQEFVISLGLAEETLISASGDGTIRFWNFLNGEQLAVLNTNQFIDDETVDKFCKEVTLDEMEVTALPITKMEVYHSDNVIFIGVTLLKYKKLLLFSVNSKTFHVNYCKHLPVVGGFSFKLDEELIILTSSDIKFYCLKDGYYVSNFVKNVDLLDVYELQFENEDNISLLYKKRFDNVGKYIERKKARMELK